jgi:hypothetical protein
MQEIRAAAYPRLKLGLETSHFKKHLRVIRGSPDKSICEVKKL